MPNNNFTQIWEDPNEEEWEVQYHLEGNDEPWIEIDKITSIADGRSMYDVPLETILSHLNKNHCDQVDDDLYTDYYGEND